MNTILLLGGGSCQLSAARRAKQMGLRVVLADYTANPPAAQFCDVHVQISSFDTQACLAAARAHAINGVVTVGTDQPVYTAAVVSATLGLPSLITAQTAYAVTNKREMKARMDAHAIPSATHCLVHAATPVEQIAALGAPYVLKPLDSQGQRGIFKLQAPDEVLVHLPETLRFSREEIALVEHFYESDEVTVSAWVKDGRVLLCSVTDRLLYPSNRHIGVCTGHRFPSVHCDKTPLLHSLCVQLCHACGIENGPLYVQFLVGAQGVLVNELACRIGGAFEDFSIPYLSGFDMLGAVLQSALGQPVDTAQLEMFDVNRCPRCIATQLLFCRSGTVGDTTPLVALRALPFVLDAGYNYARGDTVPVMENATARFGHAVLTGADETEMRRNINTFYEILSVTDTCGQSMLHRLYPIL